MLKTEEITENGIQKVRSYSDREGVQIRKLIAGEPTDELYDEAVDIAPLGNVSYVEVGSDEEKALLPQPEFPEA